MMRFVRRFGTTILSWALVLFLGGAAIAGVGAKSANHTSHEASESIESSMSESPEASESPEPPESPEASPSPNHGECVSHWAHEAKKQGLEGKFFGQFISSVAQSDQTGATCDFSAELAKALADQAAAPEHGTKGDDSHETGEHQTGSEHSGSGHSDSDSGDDAGTISSPGSGS